MKHSDKEPVLTGLDKEGVPDKETPEWNKDDFRKAKSFSQLPEELQKGLSSLKKRGRPRVAAPKRVKSFKLSPDVIEGICSSGAGYNGRVDKVLREALEDGRI